MTNSNRAHLKELKKLLTQITFTDDRGDSREGEHWLVYVHPWPGDEQGLFDATLSIIPRTTRADRGFAIATHRNGEVWLADGATGLHGHYWVKKLEPGSYKACLGRLPRLRNGDKGPATRARKPGARVGAGTEPETTEPALVAATARIAIGPREADRTSPAVIKFHLPDCRVVALLECDERGRALLSVRTSAPELAGSIVRFLIGSEAGQIVLDEEAAQGAWWGRARLNQPFARAQSRIPVFEVVSASGPLAGEDQGAKRRSCALQQAVRVLLVHRRRRSDSAPGVAATLNLELLGGGDRRLEPDPEHASVWRDEEFRSAERNAREFVRATGVWDEATDVRWRLERRDGRPLPRRLEGNSLGGAFALGLLRLLWLRREAANLRTQRSIESAVLAHHLLGSTADSGAGRFEFVFGELLGSVDTNGIAITAAVTTEGSLLPVGQEFDKLLAAARDQALPRIHTVIVAANQDLSGLGLVEDSGNRSLLRDPGADFHVVRASTLAEAVKLLVVETQTRWAGIDCGLAPADPDFVGRERLIAEVRRFTDQQDSGWLVISGAKGKGKSALMAELIRSEQERGGEPVYHIIDYDPSPTGRPQSIASCLYDRLRRKHVFLEPRKWARLDVEEKLRRLLKHLSEAGHREVIYIDAADQAECGARYPLVPSSLRQLPRGVICVIASRTHMELLGAWQSPTVLEMDQYANDRVDIREYLGRQGDSVTPPLSPRLIEQIVSQPEPPVFSSIVSCLRQLRDPGRAEEDKQELRTQPSLWVVPPRSRRRAAAVGRRLSSLHTPLDFGAEIRDHLSRFTGRREVIDRINEWLADSGAQRIFWITGRPGVGKTTIACWLCEHRDEIAAFHLCRYGHARKSDPRECVRSIASQLCVALPDYEARLGALDLDRILESNARSLFDELIVQPLAGNFPRPRRPVVILLDGLDEATDGERNELADLIASESQRTPDWLRFIVTSRADRTIEMRFQGFEPYPLDSAPNNQKDIREYLVRELVPYAADGVATDPVVDSIVARSEGLFLYAEWVRKELRMGRLSLKRPDEFPQGLGGVYAMMCERQFPDLASYEQRIRPALAIVSAAQEPIQVEVLASILRWSVYKRTRFRRALGALFAVSNAGIQPFHRSLMEWLTSRDRAGSYLVSVHDGHKRLADFGWQQYKKGAAALSRYMLSHLPAHLSRLNRKAEVALILSDSAFIESRFAAGLTFEMVADLAAAASAGLPMDQISAAVVEALRVRLSDRSRPSERFRQQLRSALTQTFRGYRGWPEPLKRDLEERGDFNALLFLADTLDMEGMYDEAERVLRRMRRTARSGDANDRFTCAVKLAIVLDHQNRQPEALDLLEKLVSSADAHRCDREIFSWAQYHRGILLRRLRKYDKARQVLDSVRSNSKDLAISALHQLANIDLALDQFDQAEEKYNQCLAERGDDESDHRRAYEYHGLGRVYALTGRDEDAREAFVRAITISLRCGNWRYSSEVRASAVEFLLSPHLRRTQPERISIPEIAERFCLDEAHIALAFRRLEGTPGYVVEVLDSDPVRPTGQAVRWDVAHSEGCWHASVSVVAVDRRSHIALQQRGEPDSKGKWDVSAAGHQDVGESDLSAAARELEEELGIKVISDRLVRIGKPGEFRKVGLPAVDTEWFAGPNSFVYRTDKTNLERVSVFIVSVDEREKKQIVTGNQAAALSVRWLPLSEAVREARAQPEQFASGLRQLLHEQVIAEIARSLAPRD